MIWHVLGEPLSPALLDRSAIMRGGGALGELARSGAVARMAIERGALWVWKAADASWATVGPTLREALMAALHEPRFGEQLNDANALGHQVKERPGSTLDAVIGLVARDVVAGELAEFIASHGGDVRVVTVTDGSVYVELGGSCAHCAFASVTLHQRLDKAIRARVPELAGIVDVTPGQSRQVFSWAAVGQRLRGR